MSSTERYPGGGDETATQLMLRIWHPDCWTLKSTATADAGLIAHGVYTHEGVVSACLTAYADTTADIDELVDTIDDSPLTDSVARIHEQFSGTARSDVAGNATEELLVRYEPANSIHDAFVSRGFVPEEEIRIYDGHEHWTVIVSEDRATIMSRLDEIREAMNATISIEGMKSTRSANSGAEPASTDQLSERQREVLELARQEGYYTWPRETSASELAEKLGVSKTTLLEHLRKAEAKLLGPD
jgi:predicted DNA binding protein